VQGHALSGTGQTADDEDAHAGDVSEGVLPTQAGSTRMRVYRPRRAPGGRRRRDNAD
jgi:hypothetical protein